MKRQVMLTPWRMGYIANTRKKSASSCIFCDLPKQKSSSNNLVLFKNEFIFVVLNKFPYSNGHLMVMPRRHLKNFQDIDSKEHENIGFFISKCVKALSKSYNPDGYNIGLNIGRVAGAGIENHLHYHIVPRWNGDSNFMTIINNTRLIPEDLEKTYQKLVPFFK